MSDVRVQVVLNNRNLDSLLRDRGGEVPLEVERRGMLVLNEARRLCPVDKGTLRASLFMETGTDRGEWVARIGSPLEYAVYVHEGTGVYAGRGPITPKRASVLAWRRNGKWHFAKQVQGQPPQPFLVDALNALPR